MPPRWTTIGSVTESSPLSTASRESSLSRRSPKAPIVFPMLKTTLLRCGYALIRVLASTYRFRLVGTSPTRGLDGHAGYILATWHQNLFAGILAQSRLRHTMMVSRSRDGDPVAYLCSKMGHHVVRGSSKKGLMDKGGKLAKDEMIEVLRTGMPGAITVDGPRGPAHEVKPGIIEMARLAGVPIIPYIAMPMRYWSFSSWDAFRLPKPFTRIDVHYGPPMTIDLSTAFENFAQHQRDIADALQSVAEKKRDACAAALKTLRKTVRSPRRAATATRDHQRFTTTPEKTAWPKE